VATPTSIESSASSGKVIGSMQYLAPEQLEEDDIDVRADIYSFGCILYEMITGQRTFPDRNVTRLVKKRVKNEFVQLASFNITIPQRLKNIINQCLQLDVNKRPSDIKNVQEDLDTILKTMTKHEPEDIVSAFITGRAIEEGDDKKNVKHHIITKIITGAFIALSLCFTVLYLLLNGKIIPENRFVEVLPAMAASEKKMEIKKDIHTTVSKQKSQVKDRNITQEKPSSVDKTVITQKATATQQPAINAEPLKKDVSVTAAKINRTVTNKRTDKKKSNTNYQNTDMTSQAFNKTNTQKEIEKESVKNEYSENELQEERDVQEFSTPIDMIQLMKKADEAREYSKVLDLYLSLPPEQIRTKEARILKLRALLALNKADKLYFDGDHINDGEFYLAKAKFLYGAKQYQQSLWLLGIAKATPGQLIDRKTLEIEALYLIAKCRTAIFNETPNNETRTNAMKCWFDVKNEFRKNQNHPYFNEANNSIRELGRKG